MKTLNIDIKNLIIINLNYIILIKIRQKILKNQLLSLIL